MARHFFIIMEDLYDFIRNFDSFWQLLIFHLIKNNLVEEKYFRFEDENIFKRTLIIYSVFTHHSCLVIYSHEVVFLCKNPLNQLSFLQLKILDIFLTI